MQLFRSLFMVTLLTVPLSVLVAEDAAPRFRTFTGQVLNADGTPAMGAKIRNFTFEMQAPATTDQHGHFKVQFDRERYLGSLVIDSADGMERGVVELLRQRDLTQTPAEESLEPIHLKPIKSFTVKVVNAAGEPVESAAVYLQSGYTVADRQVTPKSGLVTVKYFVGSPLMTIGAVKSEVGCDYHVFKNSTDRSAHPNDLPQEFTGEVELVLNGVRELTVKVTGPNPETISDIRLDPWLINKPNRSDSWNLPSIREFSRTSNAEGIARFDMIPIDQQRGLEIWPRLRDRRYYAIGQGPNDSAYFSWKKDEHADTATVEIREKVKVGGQVTLPDGQPAEGINIAIIGSVKQGANVRTATFSDAKGHWEALVKPDGYYMFVVQDDTYAAKAIDGIFVLDLGAMLKAGDLPAETSGEPSERMLLPAPPLNFELQPALRVYGTVSGHIDDSVYVMLQQRGESYYDLPEELQILNDDKSRRAVSAFTQSSQRVAEDGHFEFKVGPGQFTIWNPQRSKTERFELSTESKEFNFTIERPLNGPVTIRTVKHDEHQPLANVKVKSSGLEDNARSYWSGVTDQSGMFTLTRPLEPVLVVAESTDQQWAGFGKMTADDKELTIALKPAVTVKGQVVNGFSKPQPGIPLEIGIQVKTPSGLMSNITNHKVTTDAEGRFLVSGLCQGIEHIVHRVNLDADGEPRSWSPLKSFTPTTTTLDLRAIEAESR